MIPTGYKSKIPKTHSYPLNAKPISDALLDVPQRELLKIDFASWKTFAKDRVPGAPYRVLSASYSGGAVFPGWTLYVYPVPRSLRHLVKDKLVTEALPKIRNWLTSNFHSSAREGGHNLSFSFDEPKNELTSEEYSSMDWQTERA